MIMNFRYNPFIAFLYVICLGSMPSFSLSVLGDKGEVTATRISSSITTSSSSNKIPPIVYTIAGSDSGGGAGIQADLHAIHAFGCHGCSAITCLTAQNSVGVTAVHSPPASFLHQQLTTLLSDLPPMAIKIGMLGTAELAKTVGAFLKEIRQQNSNSKVWVVLDPVMISTSGHRLIEADAQQAMIDFVFPYIDILTPNKFEAEALLNGRILNSPQDVEIAARDLLEFGIPAVLIKGGHTLTNEDQQQYAQDYFLSVINDEAANFEPRLCECAGGSWIQSIRFNTDNTHGTGCTLSSSIAAALALGEQARQFNNRKIDGTSKLAIEIEAGGCWTSMDLLSACCLAKAYVSAGIELGVQLGQGPGPVRQTVFPNSYANFPSIVANPTQGGKKISFRKLQAATFGLTKEEGSIPPLGRILPIVDSVEWVERLCQTKSVTQIQLRIKDCTDSTEILHRVRAAQTVCHNANVRLWINDHWQAAVSSGCFGVHVGQEDLYRCIQAGGLEAISKANMALGISTHSFSELAAAVGIQPSYVSLGPIFATGSKKVNFDPQGLTTVKQFRSLVSPDLPLVAIGGIGNAVVAAQVRDAGADCIAVIGAVTQPTDTKAAVLELSEATA